MHCVRNMDLLYNHLLYNLDLLYNLFLQLCNG